MMSMIIIAPLFLLIVLDLLPTNNFVALLSTRPTRPSIFAIAVDAEPAVTFRGSGQQLLWHYRALPPQPLSGSGTPFGPELQLSSLPQYSLK